MAVESKQEKRSETCLRLGHIKLEHGTAVSKAYSDVLTALPLNSKEILPYIVTRAVSLLQFNNAVLPLVSGDG